MAEGSTHKGMASTGKKIKTKIRYKQKQMEMESIYTTLKEEYPSSIIIIWLEKPQ